MLTDLGRWALPRVDAVIEDAIDYLFAFQLYVQRWRDVLDV